MIKNSRMAGPRSYFASPTCLRITLPFLFILILFSSLTLMAEPHVPVEDVTKLKKSLDNSKDLDALKTLNLLSGEYSKSNKDSALQFAKAALKVSERYSSTTEKADALLNLVYAYYLYDSISLSEAYLKRAQSISASLNYKHGLGVYYEYKGLLNWQKSNFPSALENYNQALKISGESGDQAVFAQVLNNIGLVYWRLSNYSQAIEYYLRALVIREKLGDQYWLATTLNNLGRVYNDLNNYNESLKYSERALRIGKDLKSNYIMGRAISNIGVSYDKLNLFDKSLGYYKEALLVKERAGDKKGIAYSLLDIGKTYYNISNYPMSIENYRKALAISTELSDNAISSAAYLGLGKAYYKLADYRMALKNTDAAFKLAQAGTLRKVIQDCYYTYSQIYSGTGNYKKALEFYKTYDDMEESINSLEASKRISGLEKAYTTEKKLQELEIQRKNQSLDLEKERIINYILIGGSVLGIVFFIVLLNRYKLAKRMKELSDEKSREIETQKAQLVEINAMKDKFFSIMAHDLKNPFHLLIGLSDMLLDEEHEIEEEERRMLTLQIRNVSKNSYNLLEDLLHWAMSQTNNIKINPRKIELSDIISEVVCSAAENAKAKNIQLSFDNLSDVFAFEDYNVVSTVLRNLLSNAIKFTNEGGTIKIYHELTDDEIILTVEDNGIGMPEDKINNLFRIDVNQTAKGTNNEKGTGLGLILCKEFLEKTQNRIWAESQPGIGSRFSFTLKKFMTTESESLVC